jgi:iron(III) transport system ATP-binding protein
LLVLESDVLLMDEPLFNLDAKLRVEVRAEIREVQRRVGITTLYVTHDQEEALTISDTIAVMRDGRIVQLGEPREIYERPADSFVAGFVGQVNLLRGTADAGSVRVGSLQLPLPLDTPPCAAGQALIAALRPEAIRLRPPAEGQALAGHVASATYLGTAVRYVIDVAGEQLTVDDHDPAGRSLARGAVGLVIDPARVRVWPAGSNEPGSRSSGG